MTSALLLPLLAANALAVAFLVLALYRPNPARVIAGGGFILAALVNATLAILDPQIYITGFGPHAVGIYKTVIYGVLAHGPTRFILAIAVWQLAVGAAILVNSTDYTRLGSVAATIFLIGISPLGLGCAFPSNLILAAGMVALIRLKWPLQAHARI
ncbi:MAG TPA: hypothetical protein VN893_06185 [Bryobacteraceae bacterium]|nr:hypothetical protein [Bryobacteraceae bacterium]